MSTNGELIKYTIEEFTWLQRYMRQVDKDSPAYQDMKDRYTALKVILQSSGVSLDELDHIKE